MPAPTTLDFEATGGRPGLAAAWTVVSKSSASDVCGFSDSDYAASVADIARPDQFDHAPTWTLQSVTVSANAIAAPDGTMTADEIVETVANNFHGVLSTASISGLAGPSYSVTCWFKDHTRRYVGLLMSNGGGTSTAYCFFDLQNGVFTTREPMLAGNFQRANQVVHIDPASGWYRLELAAILSAPTTFFSGPILSNDGTTVSYVGNVTKSVYAYGGHVFSGREIDVDGFELGWSVDAYTYALVDWPAGTQLASYATSFITPNAYENFESAWANYPFLFAIASAETAAYDVAPEGFEDFEEEWSHNESYAFDLASWGGGTASATPDTFETGWSNNDYAFAFAGPGIDLTGRIFDGVAGVDSPEGVEDFEEVIRDIVVTLNTGTDTFTATAHGLINGQTVYVQSSVGGGLPTPFNGSTRYFVITAAANTFQLSLFDGGAAVNATDTGIGELSVRGDPVRYWNEPNYNTTLG